MIMADLATWWKQFQSADVGLVTLTDEEIERDLFYRG